MEGSHPQATDDCAEGEGGTEMNSSGKLELPELSVGVRRHPGDWQTAVYRFSDIDDIHSDSVSGGVGRKTSRPALFGYVMCDSAVTGEVAHSCRHGPGPHRIKVCIPKACNKEDWKAIEVALKARRSASGT
jgi:hypothetical protein